MIISLKGLGDDPTYNSAGLAVCPGNELWNGQTCYANDLSPSEYSSALATQAQVNSLATPATSGIVPVAKPVEGSVVNTPAPVTPTSLLNQFAPVPTTTSGIVATPVATVPVVRGAPFQPSNTIAPVVTPVPAPTSGLVSAPITTTTAATTTSGNCPVGFTPNAAGGCNSIVDPIMGIICTQGYEMVNGNCVAMAPAPPSNSTTGGTTSNPPPAGSGSTTDNSLLDWLGLSSTPVDFIAGIPNWILILGAYGIGYFWDWDGEERE